MGRLLKVTEIAEQKAFFSWVDLMANSDPRYALIFAVPNGMPSNVFQGRQFKESGMRAGVPDIIIPIAAHGFHSAAIELKIKPNRLQPKQQEWLDNLTLHGWYTEVAWSCDELMQKTQWYLG